MQTLPTGQYTWHALYDHKKADAHSSGLEPNYRGLVLCRDHDDVIKWKHFPLTGPLCGEFTGHRWIPLTKASDAELWCFRWSAPWINSWVNNREAGDLRRHRTHYDAIVMSAFIWHKRECIISTHWNKVAAILQLTISDSFSFTKMSEFRFEFLLNLFPSVGLTISYHWFRFIGLDGLKHWKLKQVPYMKSNFQLSVTVQSYRGRTR